MDFEYFIFYDKLIFMGNSGVLGLLVYLGWNFDWFILDKRMFFDMKVIRVWSIIRVVDS